MRNAITSFICSLLLLSAIGGLTAYGQSIPPKPNPPRLVNDFAGVLSPGEEDQLETKLLDFEATTSNEITVVTISQLDGYDVGEYAFKLGQTWGVGKSGKNNGVVIFASINDHKINISTGKGLEGALPDIICGRIIRNEMAPSFRHNRFYEGFSKASDAVIAATKGEYKADKKKSENDKFPAAVILLILFFIFIMILRNKGGGGGGGYASGRGWGDFATGMILGDLMSRGRHRHGHWGGGGSWGGGSSGGGGFGGFGGGGFGGGGASGGW